MNSMFSVPMHAVSFNLVQESSRGTLWLFFTSPQMETAGLRVEERAMIVFQLLQTLIEMTMSQSFLIMNSGYPTQVNVFGEVFHAK